MSTDENSTGSGNEQAMMAEFVLGLLDAPTHARMERLVESDPRLRAERDYWISQFAPLNEQFEEVAAPRHILPAIEARVFGGPQPRPAGWWNSLLVWRGIAAGALAVAVASIGLSMLEPRPDVGSLTTQLVAALEEEGSDIRFVALYDGVGTLRLTALSGQTAPDRDLELWAIQGDAPARSMGVVPLGEAIEVQISPDIMQDWSAGNILALTLEPKGGSPTGVATGPIVAKGAVTRI